MCKDYFKYISLILNDKNNDATLHLYNVIFKKDHFLYVSMHNIPFAS